jgi:hypothetical protein
MVRIHSALTKAKATPSLSKSSSQSITRSTHQDLKLMCDARPTHDHIHSTATHLFATLICTMQLVLLHFCVLLLSTCILPNTSSTKARQQRHGVEFVAVVCFKAETSQAFLLLFDIHSPAGTPINAETISIFGLSLLFLIATAITVELASRATTRQILGASPAKRG